MLHIKDFIDKTMTSAPYQKTLRVKVICTETPKNYQNEKGEARSMKICSVADEESAIKMIVYDTSKFSHIENGNAIVVRNFIPKGDCIVITRNSKLLLTSDIYVPDAVEQDAMSILHPPPPPVSSLVEAKKSPMKKRVTVKGKVIEEHIKQVVNVKNSQVAIRNITIKDGKETCKIGLWREKADLPVKAGDFVTISDLVVNTYKNEVSLMSTSFTSIEKSEEEEKLIMIKVIAFDIDEADEITFMTEEEGDLHMDLQVFVDSKGITKEDAKLELMGLCNNSSQPCTVKGTKVLNI